MWCFKYDLVSFFATKEKHLTGFKKQSGVKKVFLKENYACGAS